MVGVGRLLVVEMVEMVEGDMEIAVAGGVGSAREGGTDEVEYEVEGGTDEDEYKVQGGNDAVEYEVEGGTDEDEYEVEGGAVSGTVGGIHCCAIFFSTRTTRRMTSKKIKPKAM